MTRKKRTDAWSKFKVGYATTRVRSEIKSMADDPGAPPGYESKRRKIIEEYRTKEIELRNSAAPSSINDRWYPKEFTIKKVEE